MTGKVAKKVWELTGYVPVTVLLLAGASGWLAVNGFYGMEGSAISILVVLNPAYLVGSLLTHSDWSHYAGNMTILVPVGIVLTWLTNNRHVLGTVLISHVPAVFVVGLTLHRLGIGASAAAYGLLAATLVRGTDVAAQRQPFRTLWVLLFFLMAPFTLGILYVGVTQTSTDVGHFAHLFGFVFGGAYEAIYVLSEREQRVAGTEDSRQAPWQG